MQDAPSVPVTRLPGYMLAQVYRVLRHAMDDELRTIGLTTPQWGTLGCLQGREGCSSADIARLHHLTPQTMNTIVHNLEQRGLIAREPHPEHGTVLQLHLTEAGRERLDEATRRVEAVHERMVSDLTPDERTLLKDMLTRCLAALEAHGPIGAGDPSCPEL